MNPELLPLGTRVNIARDIAMMTLPKVGNAVTVTDVIDTYNLTSEGFIQLTKDYSFQDLVRTELRYVQALGPMAAQRLRAEAMASALQEMLFTEVQGDRVEFKQKLMFLETLLKSAGTDMPMEVRQRAAAASQQKTAVGVNVTFNIPQMSNPKLKHLQGEVIEHG